MNRTALSSLFASGIALMLPALVLSCSLTRLTVTDLGVEGAIPIRGQSHGPLYTVAADTACDPSAGATQVPDLQIAGTVGGSLVVRLGLTGCDAVDLTKPATCSWQMTAIDSCSDDVAPIEGRETWIGPRGPITVGLPDRTGVYRLSLSCAIGGTPTNDAESLTATVYALYGPPMPIVTPPDPRWLDRAADWGCGFSGNATEGDVLRQMLAKLYAYGGEHWRYGSFDAPEHSEYEPYNEGTRDDPWWSCPWVALAVGDTCNFTDCYGFTQVFEHVASTLGIGVFEPIANLGDEAQGLATVPGGRSLDSKFTSNITCRLPTDNCPAYVFSSHSLRRRDSVVFDPTFNGIYADPDDFIRHDVDEWQQGVIFLVDAVPLLGGKRGYGDWSFWEMVMGEVEIGEPELEPVGGATISAPTLTVDEAHLLFELPISIEKSGVVEIFSVLVPSDPSLPEVIPSRPGVSHFPIPVVAGPTTRDIQLSFHTETLSTDPTVNYQLRVAIQKNRKTPPLARSTFPVEIPEEVRTGENRTHFTGLDLAPDSETGDTLDLRTELWVPERLTDDCPLGLCPPREYLLQARLSREGHTLGYAWAKAKLASGKRSMNLSFPADALPSDGAVTVSVEAFRVRDVPWYEDSIDFFELTVKFRDGHARLEVEP